MYTFPNFFAIFTAPEYPHAEKSKHLLQNPHLKFLRSEGRIRFSDHQRLILEKIYILDKNPGHNVRRQIAKSLNTTKRRIDLWFSYNRHKERKMYSSSKSKSKIYVS